MLAKYLAIVGKARTIMHENFSHASPKANTIISENETRCRVTVSSYFAGAAKAEISAAEAIT